MNNYNYGAFRSTNFGDTWGAITGIYGINKFVSIQQCCFAAGYYGIFQSTNEGATWNRVATGLMDSGGTAMT